MTACACACVKAGAAVLLKLAMITRTLLVVTDNGPLNDDELGGAEGSDRMVIAGGRTQWRAARGAPETGIGIPPRSVDGRVASSSVVPLPLSSCSSWMKWLCPLAKSSAWAMKSVPVT